jgi:hypothetical protein
MIPHSVRAFFPSSVLNFMVLGIFFFGAQSVQSCSMAIHDWELRFQCRIPLQTTLVPLCEVDLAAKRFSQAPVSAVYWLTHHSPLSVVLSGFISAFSSSRDGIPWHPRSATQAPDAAIMQPSTGKAPLIIGSDEHSLRFVLFSDRHSGYRCHQIVLLETKRLRAVHYDKTDPWAQEKEGRAWLSIIFFDLPLPEQFLSVSFSPSLQHDEVSDLYTNPDLVKALIASKHLRLRPSSAYTSAAREIPEMPE